MTDDARAANRVAYTFRETHTWVRKAADLFGLGTNALRWIATDAHQRMDPAALSIIAPAGTVATGAVDPIRAISEIAKREHLWLHIDGAYGVPAAALPDAHAGLKSLHLAGSLAVDPHKWFYAPLDAGRALVRNLRHLTDTVDYSPAYYRIDGPLNYYRHRSQDSRGLRALKVWMGLRAAGRQVLIQTISEDIALALEALTTSLSISTFR